MAIAARAKLEKEILQHGKLCWTEQADADGSPAFFETQILEPLRELHAAGLFGELKPHWGSYRTGRRIDKVTISLVNEDYDVRSEDSPS